jgi:hypothetical protein
MDRAANAPSRRGGAAWRALAPAFALVAVLPTPALGFDVSDLLRSGAGMQAAREAQRAMQDQRTNDAAQRQRADADVCAPVKAWLASVPAAAASQRSDDWMALLDDARFAKAFGKTYDQLTIADLRQLQETQASCQRAGTLTPAEQQVVQQLLNPSMQPQWARQVASARALRSEMQALLGDVAALPPGLAGLEKGVVSFNAITSKAQGARIAATELATFRDELIARRVLAVTAATAELAAAAQMARSEAEVAAVVSRHLLDLERQQAGRAATQAAAERVAALRQAGEAARVAAAANERAGAAAASDRAAAVDRAAAANERVASAKSAQATPGKTSASTGGTVLTDPGELRKYEAGGIVRAVYHADLSGLKDDTVFTRKYLIAQAGHLGGNCDSFKASEVRAYENALAREVATAVQRNTGELLRQSLNLYVQAQRNMASVVDAAAAQQRIEDAPEFAVSDIERLAKTYGGCDAPVIVRYTRNLRAVLDRSR